MIDDLFLDCSEAAAALIDSDPVAARWHSPSALDGYSVQGLAGHLARAVLTVERYLDKPPPPAGAALADAAGYFTRVLADHAPVTSDLHRKVRDRGESTAADGSAALASQVRATAERLRGRVAGHLDQPVEVLDAVALTLEEYLRTRLVELVVHIDDLAVSVGHDRSPPLPEDAYRVVAGVLGQLATDRAGGLETVRGLARRERHPDAVRAL